MKTVKWFVEFHYPGLMLGDSSEEEYTGPVEPKDVAFADNSYAFTIWKRTDIEEDGETFKGERSVVGKRYYYHPDSRITSLEEMKTGSVPGVTEILLSNMRINKWDSVIWTRLGNWPQPYDAERMEVLS